MPSNDKRKRKAPEPAGRALPERSRTPALNAQSEEQKGRFLVVALGASAGGLSAIEAFFRHMPVDSGMAFVLITHTDPDRKSLLHELVQKTTSMPVMPAASDMKAAPNHVYTIPSDKYLTVLDGTFQLWDITEHRGPRLPIDFFFRALAQDFKDLAVAIVLSGMGADGSVGLREVKGEGGLVLAQDPAGAQYDSMPRQALRTGLVDHIFPVEKMPEFLISYAKHRTRKKARLTPAAEGSEAEELRKIHFILRTQTGRDFSLYKPNTVWRRIERRMHVHQLDNVADYTRHLQRYPQEVHLLLKELLIGVTSFFRDPEAFDQLRRILCEQILPSKPPQYTLRVWVPGCSTGEEAYSVSMLFKECVIELKLNIDMQVFATDIDIEAVDQARAGVYPESIALDVNPERLKQFFTKEGSSYKIRKDIRDMLIFAIQDVIKDPPFTRLDLLSCRNLMIYLEPPLQRKLVTLFHYSLKPDGFLFLGSAESIETYGGDQFTTIDKRWKLYQRKGPQLARKELVDFSAVAVPSAIGPYVPAEHVVHGKQPSITQLAQSLLLAQYAPPSVIVNEKGEILYIHGRTGRYLEPAPGAATLNIVEMAREGLRQHLPTMLHAAGHRKEGVSRRGLQVKSNGHDSLVTVSVRPLTQNFINQGLLLVVFEEESATTAAAQPKKRSGRKGEGRMVEALEEELRYTKENLQSTIEELETSNEELKSTNEELQSTNEELQSANEELETSREEHQSLNEELVTVNTELQSKMEELSKTFSDMKNLFDAIEVPTIFLDTELRIKRFSSHASAIVNMIPADIDRPLEHLVTNLTSENLVEDAQAVLKTLQRREREVQTKNGHWYLMRATPYRSLDNLIEGLVIVFLDIDQYKKGCDAGQKLNT